MHDVFVPAKVYLPVKLKQNVKFTHFWCPRQRLIVGERDYLTGKTKDKPPQWPFQQWGRGPVQNHPLLATVVLGANLTTSNFLSCSWRQTAFQIILQLWILASLARDVQFYTHSQLIAVQTVIMVLSLNSSHQIHIVLYMSMMSIQKGLNRSLNELSCFLKTIPQQASILYVSYPTIKISSLIPSHLSLLLQGMLVHQRRGRHLCVFTLSCISSLSVASCRRDGERNSKRS